MDINNIVGLDIFDEASHGKLKYDFRMGWDINTGHAVKVVYSLDNIKVVGSDVGVYKDDKENLKNINYKSPEEVQKIITKKGNLDHASHGQKVLAIVDLTNNKRLNEADIIGAFTVWASSIDDLHLDDLDYVRNKLEDPITREKYLSHVKVGEIENYVSYKSTHWYKGNPIEDITLRDDIKIKGSKLKRRIQNSEGLITGRGTKLNDISKDYIDYTTGHRYPTYNHPSKKDIKRNPELYRERLSDEEFEKLMKNKTAKEVKEDIDAVKEEIKEINQSETMSEEEQIKKRSLLSILRENLKKLIEWLKKIARSIGLIESVIEESSDDELYEYIEANEFIEEESIDMEFMEAVMGKVKDGYMGELPEDLQKKIIEANKIIVAEVNSLIKEDRYQDLHNSRWAMSCLDDFCTKPSPKDDVGSFRLYQKKKTYECMIQCTGHFKNFQYGWIEDLLNSFIKDLFFKVRPTIRKKFDMTLKSEGDNGNPEEGFDIYPSKKEAEELWNKFEDKKIKSLKESSDIMDEEIEGYTEMSHGKLKYSFRLAINKDNGHIVKIVFDLDPNSITLMGSHDGTNPIPDDKQDELAKNIRKTGFTDFASVGKVLAIVDMDTKEKLKTVSTVGIMNGNHEWAEKPLKKRENDIKNGTKFYGTKTFTVGEVEGNGKRFYQGSYKTTKSPKDAHDLRNVVNGHRKGRGYVKESEEFTEGLFDIFKSKKKFEGGTLAFSNLPEGLRNLCKNTTALIKDEFIKSAESLGLKDKVWHIDDAYGGNDYNVEYVANIIAGKQDVYFIYQTLITKGYHTDIIVSSAIGTFFDVTTEEFTNDTNKILKATLTRISVSFINTNPGKSLLLDDTISSGRFHENELYFVIRCDAEYTDKLINFINDPKNYPLTEATEEKEEEESVPNYNTEMSEKEAKKTLRALSKTIISNNEEGDPGKGKNKVSQYTANTYANIITKNLLPKWAPSFKKFSITLDSYQSFYTVEFKTPSMSQDFISRYVDGKEPLNAFLHRIPEIKLRMSPRVFHTMKNPDDAFNFFKAAIQYYDHYIERYSKNLMGEVFKLNHNMKHLIGTTKLSSIVTIPLKLLFVFEDVHMDNKNTFKISSEDISAISKFVKNIYTSYAAPEKEKKKIIDDMKNVVKELREKCEADDDFGNFACIVEAVESFLSGKYDSNMDFSDKKWITENIDIENMKAADHQTSALYEKFGVKKLKKIPSDLIAYITIEAESIKDANDKMMIASYCCSKIEIVEWYIELLEVGSKKYIVPHTKPYLETVRTQLLQCYKKIMNTPIPKQDRAIISVGYPKGYEG